MHLAPSLPNKSDKAEIKVAKVLKDRKNPRNLNEIGGFLMAEKEGFARLRAGRLGLQGAPGALPSALGSNPSMQ